MSTPIRKPKRYIQADRSDLAWPYDLADDGTTSMLRDLPGTAPGSSPGSSDRLASHHHLRDLLEQLLLTQPGERVMRPDLGSGLAHLIFEPAGEALAAALQAQAQAVILQHLGDRLELEGLDVQAEDSKLRITVAYRPKPDGRRRVETFERGV